MLQPPFSRLAMALAASLRMWDNQSIDTALAGWMGFYRLGGA